MEDPRALINIERLRAEMDRLGVDAIAAASPENTSYLSGCLIRTQITIRDRLALVLWPRDGEPSYIVCDIEESLARRESWIEDIRVYVEFAQSPIDKLIEVLADRGLANGRIGIEERYLSADYYHELTEHSPASFVRADEALERVRAIKMPGEIERITHAFVQTEAAIKAAWTASRAGETERQVADRMVEELLQRGADGVRHISFNSGPNTVVPHRRPDGRVLMPGDTAITDFGGSWGAFSSDMARVAIVDQPSQRIRDEYRRYQAAYVEVLHFLKPGVTGADVYDFCKQTFEASGLRLTAPHIGHSLSRAGGHDNPILHPKNSQPLEPRMLIALEPIYSVADEPRNYHLEDLILITEQGQDIRTDWRSTQEMIRIPG